MARPDLILPPAIGSVAVAGTHAETAAREAGWSEEDVDRVVLATIEAVGNAVEHGPGLPVRLALTTHEQAAEITIVVSDGGEGPSPRSLEAPSLPEANSLDGRGLYILDALADRVEVDSGAVTLTFIRRRPASG